MEIDVNRIWSSPSTLHLQCVVWGKGKRWMRLVPVHIPLQMIPSEVRAQIYLSEGFDRDEDQTLPGLFD